MDNGRKGIRVNRQVTICTLLAWLAAISPPAHAQPTGGDPFNAELTTAGIEVTGATPGGEVAIFGVWRQRHVYWSEVGRVDERLVDSDADGEVSWDLGRPIPTATVLFAVDVGSGEWGLVAPTGFPIRWIPPSSLVVSGDGSSLVIDAAAIQLLQLRAGSGVWSLVARDGGPGDALTGQDGDLVVTFNEFGNGNGLGATPAPGELMEGDRVFAVNPDSLEVLVVEDLGGGA